MEYEAYSEQDRKNALDGKLRALEQQHHEQAMQIAEREARVKGIDDLKDRANPPAFGPVLDDRKRSRANEIANNYAELHELEAAIAALKAMREAAPKKKG